MDLDQAREFLRKHHRAVFATMRRDGRPQLSPVVCSVDASGRVVISSRERAMKTKNAARDPNVSLCAFDDQFFGGWVQVDGLAQVVHLPEAMDGLIEYYRGISGEHPDWDEYRAAMQNEGRVLLAITLVRAGPDVSG